MPSIRMPALAPLMVHATGDALTNLGKMHFVDRRWYETDNMFRRRAFREMQHLVKEVP
jgi:hypothetical protein